MKKLFLQNRYFLLPQLIFLLLAGFLLLTNSKAGLHIFINQHHSPAADIFFKWITFGGDGLMYVAVMLFLLTRKLKWLMAFLLAVAVSNLILVLFKQVLFPDAYRPAKYFELFESYRLHLVEGVKMHSLHSFPSGHTTTAFTVFLMLASVSKSNLLKSVLFLAALITGFSRVYLSQHFVVDVFFGSILGSLCVVFSIAAIRRTDKAWLEKIPVKLYRFRKN